MLIRLNKFLSQAGIASRREADRMIIEGKVKVNGEIIQELGSKIDDLNDRIEVGGKRIKREDAYTYVILNKPRGYLVTLRDTFGRPTVKHLLLTLDKRVFPVGRLDYDSDGLLLLTDDGELAYRLTHPSYEIRRTYLAKVKGQPDPSKLTKLEKGIFLDGRKTAPTKISVLQADPKRSLLRIEIYEGRKREVRRMFESIGHRVARLTRVGFAGLKLEKLKSGRWRFLKPGEVRRLRKQVKL
ncbi:MAG: pseudouridine synthase [Candidatus Aminicenantaceae bacterium]